MSSESPSGTAPWRPYERVWVQSEAESTHFDFFALSYNIFNEKAISATEDDQPYLRDRPELISSTFRNSRIIQEIESWSPDFVAVQEMDVDYFGSQWLPKMAALGYVGHLAVPIGPWKGGSVALFYKHATFELKRVDCCPMEDLFNEQLRDLRQEFQLLRDPRIDGRVVNFVRLKHRPTGRSLQLACIHFLWTNYKNPLYQSFEVLAALKKVETLADGEPFLILGDFNLKPCDAQYELLSTGHISREAEALLASEMDKDRLLLTTLVREKLNHSIQIRSAYVEVQGKDPRYTTRVFEYGKWYEDTLDYIWYSLNRKIKPIEVLGMPEHEAVVQYGGIPSPTFPSDHLPVGAKFRFVQDE